MVDQSDLVCIRNPSGELQGVRERSSKAAQRNFLGEDGMCRRQVECIPATGRYISIATALPPKATNARNLRMTIEMKRITAKEYSDLLDKGVFVERVHRAQYTTIHRAHDVTVDGRLHDTVIFVPDDTGPDCELPDAGYLMIFDRIGSMAA